MSTNPLDDLLAELEKAFWDGNQDRIMEVTEAIEKLNLCPILRPGEDASPWLDAPNKQLVVTKKDPTKHEPTVIEHGFTIADLFKKGKT